MTARAQQRSCAQVAVDTAGLAFAGVHDSFWTHAGDVPRMNQLLREQFVALHSQPLLEQLLASFQVSGQYAACWPPGCIKQVSACMCWEDLLQPGAAS